jgi:hypothetical protein
MHMSFEYITARVGERDDLELSALAREEFAEFPQLEVLECLRILHEDIFLPVGVLRPGDDILELMIPPPTYNPLKWLKWRMTYEDSVGELRSRFRDALRCASSWPAPIGRLTLHELVRLWCESRNSRSRG